MTDIARSATIVPDPAAMIAALNEGDAVRAEQMAKALLAVTPSDPNARHVLALAYKQQGNLPAALEAFNTLVDEFAKAAFLPTLLHNRGNTRLAALDGAGAEADYRQALSLNPAYIECWNALGNLLRDRGEVVSAQDAYEQARRQAPDHADTLNNLGGLMSKIGKPHEAIAFYKAALAQQPDLASAHYNLGNALMDAGQREEGKKSLERAVALAPENAEAISALLRLKQSQCDWQGLDDLGQRLRQLVAQGKGGNVFPFAFISLPASRAEQRRCAEQWAARQYTRIARPLPPVTPAGDKARLKVGYLSSDLRSHAVAYLIAEVFELHDRNQFEIYAYSVGPADGSSMRARLENAFDSFEDVRSWSLEQIARQIRQDGIDILVELNGYTSMTRSGVLAYRPAPIQVNYLGYPGTLGAHADYIVGDPVATPLEHAVDYSEKLALMPWSYQANDRKRPLPPAPDRASLGLPEDELVLCSFNHTYKISEEIFTAWCRLLTRFPKAILWLLMAAPEAEANLKREAAARGVSPERLIFAPHKPLEDHLARLRQADIFLDTPYYNAHTTCSDALWAGVPVVALQGETFASRVSASLLRSVGLPNLAATNVADYERLVAQLAENPGERQAIVEHLADKRMVLPLFDTPQFTRHLETLYRGMWHRHIRGLPPGHLMIDLERQKNI